MIKRSYFYHCEKQDKDWPMFANGIITTTSWFADPDKAWGFLLDDMCRKWDCDRGKVRCHVFHPV